jgi:hypothetical protein
LTASNILSSRKLRAEEGGIVVLSAAVGAFVGLAVDVAVGGRWVAEDVAVPESAGVRLAASVAVAVPESVGVRVAV